jgi:CRISPR/Cas system-associated exonuclease Cas4 (RecB family)
MGTEFKNSFVWSVSRDSVFLECPRKYYFNYYGFWSGWEPDAPERVRELYVLKQLKNRSIWAGQVVHDCIKRSLDNLARGIPVLPLKEILSITRDRMRQDFRSSRRKLYRVNPKSNCGLFEHEYELDVPDERWRETADHVELCLSNYYRSDVYERFSRLDQGDFLEIEKFSGFDLDGVKVVIKLDCASRERDRIIVWDWKTGRSEPAGLSFQMACYAYYASRAFGIPVGHVLTRRFELFSNRLFEETVSEGSLEELLAYIRGSIKDMLSLLDDPRTNTANEENFSKVEKKQVCSRCNFFKVCRPNV